MQSYIDDAKVEARCTVVGSSKRAIWHVGGHRAQGDSIYIVPPVRLLATLRSVFQKSLRLRYPVIEAN
jgi:hypothetical protein